MILVHGTTHYRANLIIQNGPDPFYREGGGWSGNGDFSMYLEEGPYTYMPPESYAHGKAANFPNEGGPVILVVDVPEAIVMCAVTDYLPLEDGLVQFDPGAGLEELQRAWPTLIKKIRTLS